MILVNDNINTDLVWAIRCELLILILAWLVLTNITQLEVRHLNSFCAHTQTQYAMFPILRDAAETDIRKGTWFTR